MNFLGTIAKVVLAGFLLTGCTGGGEDPWDDNWSNQGGSTGNGGGNSGNDNPGGDTPGGGDQPSVPEDPYHIKGKPRYVWIDASANFSDYANDKDRIAADLQKVKETGFTDVIVDVRPTTGDVLFKSSRGRALSKIDAWTSNGYNWLYRTADFDYLQAFIDAGHTIGLRVNAAINTFVGGYLCPYGLGTIGMIFDDAEAQKWATYVNSGSGIKSTLEFMDPADDYGAKFFNPANADAQAFVLSLLKDLAAYDLDGIVLDRCRYNDDDLLADFSDESRSQFEAWYGSRVPSWPSSIFSPGDDELPWTLSNLQKAWLEFRAKTIHDFVEKASETVHGVNKDIRFGAYVGAWYSTYYNSGVNWASPKYNTSANYRWASAGYKNWGYADHCDFMFLGAYAASDSVYGNGEWTMQGFCKQGRNLLMGDTVFAGGPDVGNSSGFENGGAEAVIPSTVDACINASDGYFVFDLCHIKKYNYWSAFKQGFDNYLSTVKE